MSDTAAAAGTRRQHSLRSWVRALFWILVAATVLAHVAVVSQSLLTLRLWEDEAFNLTVPLNLLNGLGYTSDGALSGSTLTPFDPRISTGPVVLLPATAFIGLGIDPVIGARLVPLLFWAALIGGLWVLGRRIGGRWAGLLAAALPLALDASGQSAIQGPADFLGEIPAAALIVWALVALPRRAWIAGLLIGLAIQAKLIALLALPAFAVAVWALAPGTGWRRILATLRTGWLPLVLAGVPTLLLELSVLLTLGGRGYVDHLRDMVRFVRSGGQSQEPTTIASKLLWFLESWYAPSGAVAASVALGAALIVLAVVAVRRLPRELLAILLAAAVGFATYLGWWSTASHLPLWIRHPSPGVLAFLPLLAAFTVWAAATLWRGQSEIERGKGVRLAVRVLAVVSVVTVAGTTAVGVVQHAAVAVSPPTGQTLQSQRDAAAPLAEWVQQTQTDWLAAEPWGAAIPMVLLSGAHIGLFDADAMSDVPRLTGLDCATEVLVESSPYRICAAPDVTG